MCRLFADNGLWEGSNSYSGPFNFTHRDFDRYSKVLQENPSESSSVPLQAAYGYYRHSCPDNFIEYRQIKYEFHAGKMLPPHRKYFPT